MRTPNEPFYTDMSQYLSVFLDEGREQLVLLEANILEVERGNHTTEMLQTLFRAAHTLKGSSRAMGFMVIGDLTHEMENILDDLRSERLGVSTILVNALLDSLDALSQLLDAVAASGAETAPAQSGIPGLVQRLNQLRASAEPAGGGSKHPLPFPDSSSSNSGFEMLNHERSAAESALDMGLSIFEIAITLQEDCLMKSIRVWMVLSALEPLGTVLSTSPCIEKLEDEEFDRSFRLILAAESVANVVEQALSVVSEVERCIVKPWDAGYALAPDGATDSELRPKALASEQATPAAIATGATAASPNTQTVRVSVARLDSLLNLVGELVLERAQANRISADLCRRYPDDQQASQLLETTHRIALVTSKLQDQIMKARMMPIDSVFQRLPRMVRDLAQKTGKMVRFEMSGGEIELDRILLESLGDPLIHLLRNSIDHGIESPDARIAAGKVPEGLVTLSARHEQNNIVIEIADDGHGMDPEKLKQSAISKGVITLGTAGAMADRDALALIFKPGFSTSPTISDISGRGVGMDIVKSNLEKVGGWVLVDSTMGQGSRFIIHLPLTLAIVRAVLVESGGGTYVLPSSNVIEMLRLGTLEEEPRLRTLAGRPFIDVRGRSIPLMNLSDLLGVTSDGTRPTDFPCDKYVVVLGVGERQIGLCVDTLVGEQEIVIKSMGTLLSGISGISGATILANGQIALIVDINKAVQHRACSEPAPGGIAFATSSS